MPKKTDAARVWGGSDGLACTQKHSDFSKSCLGVGRKDLPKRTASVSKQTWDFEKDMIDCMEDDEMMKQ